MTSVSALTDHIEQYFEQQTELYGKDTFLLGIQPGKPATATALAPVLEMKENSEIDKPKDLSQKALLEQFNAEHKNCMRCGLGKERTQIVLGSGSAFAKVLFIGEGPGREEDAKGLPFVGDAGQILERMLKRMGFIRKEVYITNVVKCRPPGNRNPNDDEIAACAPLLQKQIQIIQPRYLFCLGKVAANALLRSDETIKALRSKVHSYHGAKTFVTYHPAALLRDQNLFWEVYEDMKLFRQVYDAEIGDKPPMVEMNRKN